LLKNGGKYWEKWSSFLILIKNMTS
jgi:hypothetical protein